MAAWKKKAERNGRKGNQESNGYYWEGKGRKKG